MAKKKKIRRGSKPKDPRITPKKLYFTKDTQAAILEFCSSECYDERAKVYEKRIQPALLKLTENLIYIYGFHKCGETPEHLQQACVVALYETLHKFDHSRGTNAFSYFNVVAKNWLIINSRKIKKRLYNSVSIDDSDILSSRDQASIAAAQFVPDPVDVHIRQESIQQIRPMCKEILSELSHKNDLVCMNAIITVFDNIDQLEFLNKRGIFVYIREISGLNSKQLSSSMTNIRRKYRQKVGDGKRYDIF
tara:strand:+ start:29346 stop:30092 length:747 start_codon:yes stop_codon:yes gene_type:complete